MKCIGRGVGRPHACRIRRRPNNGKPAGDERTPERHAAWSDQQSLLEAGSMGDDDVEITGGRGMNDLSGRSNHDAHSGHRMQRIEQRERARLIDGVGRSQPQRTRVRLTTARRQPCEQK